MFDIRCPNCGDDLGIPHTVLACDHRFCIQCICRLLLQCEDPSNDPCSCPICPIPLGKIYIAEHVDMGYQWLKELDASGEGKQVLADLPIITFRSNDSNIVLWYFQLVCVECDIFFDNAPAFVTHVIDVHKKYVCKKCLRSRKYFSWELDYFSRDDLAEHINYSHPMSWRQYITRLTPFQYRRRY